jgi:hypothetical protein
MSDGYDVVSRILSFINPRLSRIDPPNTLVHIEAKSRVFFS